MLTTMHWLPNRSAASRTNSGFLTAAELIDTLSQPALSRCANVVEVADAAPDGQRHEDHLRRALNHVEHDRPLFVAGGDVEKDQFVRPLRLITRRHLDRIAGIAEIEEIDPLDDASSMDVQARDDPFRKHGRTNVGGRALIGSLRK